MVRPCVFCQIVEGALPCSAIHEDDEFMVFMDIYPWRPGHALVIPRRHVQRVTELDDRERRDLFSLGARVADAVRASELRCDDLHFAINDGRAANQSVPHVHLHVLPRHRGDLHRLVLSFLTRPLVAVGLLGPESREVLDAQAAAIAAQLR